MYLVPVVQTLDGAIHRINDYTRQISIRKTNCLSSGQHYPPFEQPEHAQNEQQMETLSGQLVILVGHCQ